jgi:tetratricopeptide (TPR) repeat protein
MPNKRPTPKHPKRGHPTARRAGAAEPRRKSLWSRLSRPDWMLLLLLGFTLAIRLWGIHDRLPDGTLGINVLDDSAIEETDRTTMGRAWSLWRGGTRPFDPNPHTGGWPALSFYLTLGLQYAFKLYVTWTRGGISAQAFQDYVATLGAAPMFLFARVVGALTGVLTVYLTYRIAAKWLGRTVGLLAGLLLAANTLHVLTSQHVSDPNLLALLFVLLATPPLLRLAEGGTLRDSVTAGAMIGLAGACKYVPLVMVVPLALACIPGRRLKELGAGLLSVFAGLFVATPFLFLDWKRTVIDMAGQRRALFSDWVGQTVFPISLPTYLVATLPHAMGWIAYALALAGLVLLARMGRVMRLFVSIPVLMLAANGMLKSPQERYILAVLPFLYIAAAYALVRGVAWARERVPVLAGQAPVGRLFPAVLVAAAIALPMPELFATRQQLRLPDSRHLARRWILGHIDPGSPCAIELYGPVFAQTERAAVIWPFFATQSELARPTFHHEFLDGIQFHVASGEISRRFEAEPAKYPVENAYYRWLAEHADVVWRSDSTMSGPRIVIRRLPTRISTRAERDSVFAAAMPVPNHVNRVELWCMDFAKMFQWEKDWARMDEWTRRGLYVGVPEMEPPLRSLLATALWHEGQLDSADAQIRISIAKTPASATFHLIRGSILADLGKIPESLAELRQAYEVSGNDPRLHVNVAQALAKMGRFGEAVEELLKVPEGHPMRGLALRDAAILILNHSDHPGDALNYLRESIRLDPNQEQADLVRQQIAKLEAMTPAPRGSGP